MELEDIDREILKVLQGNLPVVKRPFEEISKKAKISEDEFFERVKRLTKEGIIRKFGLRIDSKKVGFKSTLVAMKVAPEKLEGAAGRISEYDFVTHNYARGHEYNLWFTIIEKDEDALKSAIEKVRKEIDCEEMLSLPIKRKFKINVRFDIK